MALIKIYDSEMIGQGTLDSFKKLFSYYTINDGHLEEKKDLTYLDGWVIDEFQSLGNSPISTDPLTGMPQIIESVRIKLSVSIPFRQSIKSFVENIVPLDTWYLYHFTYLSVPNFDDKPLSFSNTIGDNYSHYNYKMEQMEQGSVLLNEKQMPNFMIGLYKDYGLSNQEAEYYYNYFDQFNMLNHEMIAEYQGINQFNFDDQTYDYSFNSSSTDSNYFYKFTQLQNQGSEGYTQANSHVFIDFNYNQSETRKTVNAPYYIKIRIPKTISFENPTGPNSNVRDFIKETTSNKFLNNVLISSFKVAPQTLRNFTVETNNELFSQDIKIYDLPNFLEQFSDETFFESDSLYLRKPLQFFKLENTIIQNNYLIQMTNLLTEIEDEFLNKVSNLTFDKIISSNEPCYSEILGYKIQKFGDGPTPIQTFYIFNEDRSIVDTQIKFDKNYSYFISAMIAIGGVRYKYLSPISIVEEDKMFFLQILKQPSLKVAEVLVKSFQTKIVEPPPLEPQINFQVEKNTRNLLKIVIEDSKGNMFQELIKDKKIDLIRGNDLVYSESLKMMHGGENYPFSSRAFGGMFEIYRLEQMPTMMSDFNNNLIATATTLFDHEGKHLSSLMFSDYIRHNHDYYYYFRTLTHRGNPGIGSPIYKVRILEDADEMILKVTTVSISPKELVTFENTMRKYLQITPNRSQTVINSKFIDFNQEPDSNNNLANLSLGSETNIDSLWDYNSDQKFFKIRLESKKTGKKIDLNLKFVFSKPTSN